MAAQGDPDRLFFDAVSSSDEETAFLLSLHKAMKRSEEKRRALIRANSRT